MDKMATDTAPLEIIGILCVMDEMNVRDRKRFVPGHFVN